MIITVKESQKLYDLLTEGHTRLDLNHVKRMNFVCNRRSDEWIRGQVLEMRMKDDTKATATSD